MTKETLEKIVRDLLKTRLKTRQDLDSFKRKVAKKYKISCPNNVELLKIYHELTKKKTPRQLSEVQLSEVEPQIQLSEVQPQIIENLAVADVMNLLRKRPVRSLSGIVNVSVLTKPYPCKGKCIFCPEQKGIPKSYLAKEPAVQRAILNKFNPYLQVQTRLRSLEVTGHFIDKVELRIIGGTWSYYPKKYQEWFVAECFRATNNFKSKTARKVYRDHPSVSLQRGGLCKLQRQNEKAKCRIIGITIETRPDCIDLKEIKQLREFGVTRVELGVQSLYDDVLKLNKRGHKVKATIKATQLLKNAGFKVSYQMMPDLPGSNFKKDAATFEELFQNPDFKPDLLKIYPLALVKEAPLYQWWKLGKYKPYSVKQLTKLLVEIKKTVPYWCRIERVIRDIPSSDILEGGVKISNLREVVLKEMEKRDTKCKCIRCREVGEKYNPKEKLYLFREDYEASGGKEIFLSFENKSRDRLYVLLRLRLPTQPPAQLSEVQPQILLILQSAAIIREVHAYGPVAPLSPAPSFRSKGGGGAGTAQHKGLGKKLIKEAEKISQQAGYKKIAVISGVGARGYYRKKLGYKLKNTYMVKKLTPTRSV